MRIRPLAWGDYPAVTDLYLDLYREVVTNPGLGISLRPQAPTRAEEATWFGDLYRRILEGDGVASVADDDGRVVGLCTVERDRPTVEERGIGRLGVLIAPGHRGRGVGRKLLEHALTDCRGRFDVVVLTVRADNTAARRLYERVGFRTFGSLPHGFRRGATGHEVLGMWVDLEGPETPSGRDDTPVQ
jgi:ribosomal protein S18 acetylase RimI-like enzyme